MKTLLFINLLFLLQFSLWAQQDSTLADQYYDQADTTTNLEAKMELLKKALDAGYSPLFVYDRIGYIHEQKKEFDLAISYYKKSLGLVETTYQSSIMNAIIAGVFIKKEAYDSAKVYCNAALDVYKPYSVAYYNMGLILEQQHDYTTAISYFKKYLYYNRYKTCYHLVVCYEALGDYQNSLYYAEQLLEEEPDLDFAKQAKLRGLIETGQQEETLAALKKWYPASPDKGVYSLFQPYEDLGNMAFSAEGYGLARKYYECALGEFFQNQDIFYETLDADSASFVLEMKIAHCYSLEGKHDKVNTTFEKFKKTHAADHYFWYVWGTDYMEQSDYKTAVKLFKKSLKLKPDYLKAIQACAQSYARAGDHKKAAEMYTTGIDLYHENVDLFSHRAKEYILLNQLDKAYHDIQHAKELDPFSLAPILVLAEYYFAKEEFDEAIELLNEVLAPSQKASTTIRKFAYYIRGKSYASRHNGSLAIADFEETLAIDPNFAPALQELGIAIKRKGKYCEAKPHLERALFSKDKFGDYDFTRAEKTLNEIKDKNCRD